MKKILWGFAALPLLALLATSCANESVESKGDIDRVLTFKTAAGKQTLSRASEIDLGYLQTHGPLEVYSYKDNPQGEPYRTFNISYDGGLWGYSPAIFHPMLFGLDHYSVYPAGNVAIDDSVYPPKFEYVAEHDEDLMVASAHTTHMDDVQATANMVYRHVLSQVNFAIQGKDHLIVGINDIKVVGVKDSGTYRFDTNQWSNVNGSAEYPYSPARPNVTTGGVGDDNIIYYLGNEGGYGDNSYGNALMLMPQEFTGNPAAGFTFDYVLSNFHGGDMIDTGTATVRFENLPNSHEWQQGRRYLYIIAFNPVLLEFEVDVVDEWMDADDFLNVVTEGEMDILP